MAERLDRLPADSRRAGRCSMSNWPRLIIRSRPLISAQSFLGRLGQCIEPAVRPLGWDWRIGCAAIASFPAREVVMAALGIIYNLGRDLDVGEQSDQDRLAAKMRAARLGRHRRAGL